MTMTKTLRAVRFIAIMERLENAIYQLALTEAAHHDEAALELARESCHKARARVYEYLKTLSKDDIESL